MRRNDTMDAYVKSFNAKVNVTNFVRPPRDTNDSDDTPLGWEIPLQNFPPSVASAPLRLEDLSTLTSHHMTLFAGIAAIVQHKDDDGSIEPIVAWAIVDTGDATPAIQRSQAN